jgi:hypothetical protein
MGIALAAAAPATASAPRVARAGKRADKLKAPKRKGASLAPGDSVHQSAKP